MPGEVRYSAGSETIPLATVLMTKPRACLSSSICLVWYLAQYL